MGRSGLYIGSAPPLAELTTIGLGGSALALVRVEDEEGLASLPEALRRIGGKPAILGRGSNILAGSGPLPLALIELGRGFKRKAPRLLDENKERALVEVSAALPLPLFLGRLAELGLGGLGGLAGIPGSLGGAVAMNAGSCGHEITSCLRLVHVFSPVLGLMTLRREEWTAGYRRFDIPSLTKTGGEDAWFLLLGFVFDCPRQAPETIREHMRVCMEQKRHKQPLDLPSAGCVFKNPPEGPAGKLMDECGLKGRARGGMSFSSLHANFLLNHGGGRPEEALDLIEEARAAVLTRHGARLETEIKIWA